MTRRSSGRIRRLTGSSSCANAIFCPISNGYRPPPFIRELTTAHFGIPSDRLTIRSGTITDRATGGTASVTFTATDEAPTAVPDENGQNKAHDGLENNPGKDGKLFSDKHPPTLLKRIRGKKSRGRTDQTHQRDDSRNARQPDAGGKKPTSPATISR